MEAYPRKAFHEQVSNGIVQQAKDRGLIYFDGNRILLTDDDPGLLLETFGIEWCLEYRIHYPIGKW